MKLTSAGLLSLGFAVLADLPPLGYGFWWVGLYLSILNRGLATRMSDVVRPVGGPSLIQQAQADTLLNQDVDGTAWQAYVETVWFPRSDDPDQLIQGWFATDARPPGELLFFVPFNSPFRLQAFRAALYLVPRLFLGQDGIKGDGIAWLA